VPVETADRILKCLDPITRGVIQQKGRAVWFDSEEALSKRPRKENKSEVKNNSRLDQKQLSPGEQLYLQQRRQKAKGWLPKRIRKCERIKRHFKT